MCIFGCACRQQQGIGGESRIKMHGLQRTHQCPCAPTQIQVAWARFPTPVVPEPPAVLAAQPAGASEQLAPVVVSAPLEASVLRALRVRLVVLERLVILVQVLPRRSVG